MFRSIFYSKVYQYYGDIYEPKGASQQEIEIQSNALSSFLQSSLNVELVYILLESITTFSKKANEDNNKFEVLEFNPQARLKRHQMQKSVVKPILV